jgi:hypothetical protein
LILKHVGMCNRIRINHGSIVAAAIAGSRQAPGCLIVLWWGQTDTTVVFRKMKDTSTVLPRFGESERLDSLD